MSLIETILLTLLISFLLTYYSSDELDFKWLVVMFTLLFSVFSVIFMAYELVFNGGIA